MEWLRAPSVVEWKGRLNITWNARSKFGGGAERAGLESFLEMESMDLKEGPKNSQGTTILAVDLAKVFEQVHVPVVRK